MKKITLQNASVWEECTKHLLVLILIDGKTWHPSRQNVETAHGQGFQRQLGLYWSAGCHVGTGTVTCVKGKVVCIFFLLPN